MSIDTNDPTNETVPADSVSADDGVPTDDNVPDEAVVESEVSADDPAEGTDAQAEVVEAGEPTEGDPEVVSTDELLAESVVIDNPYTRPGRWFVVHTQSGYEKKVKQNLEARTTP